MSGKELWEAFIMENNFVECHYETWAFGVEADLLAHLVATGEKTATASAYPLYELENEPLPAIGAYSVILDSKDNAVCIIQLQKDNKKEKIDDFKRLRKSRTATKIVAIL